MLTPLLVLALSTSAFAKKKDKEHDASDKKDEPSVTMSGTLFGYWGLSLTEGAENYNEFGLSRAYFRMDGKLNDQLGGRITLDADRFKAATLSDGSSVTVDTKQRVFVKHAYLEWKGVAPGVKLRAGIIDTPIGPYMDDFWGHRFIADNYTAWAIDLPTADFGVGLLGKAGKGMLDWHVNIVNGEGYKKPEVDAGKTVQARISVNPLAKNEAIKLPITAYVSYAANPDDNQAINALGAVGLDTEYVLFSGQFLMTNQADVTGTGYSIVLEPRIPDVATLVLRYDSYDPNGEVEEDGKTQLIAGVSHFFVPKVATSLTFEQSKTQAAPDDPTQGIFVRFLAGF